MKPSVNKLTFVYVLSALILTIIVFIHKMNHEPEPHLRLVK